MFQTEGQVKVGRDRDNSSSKGRQGLSTQMVKGSGEYSAVELELDEVGQAAAAAAYIPHA